MQAKKRKKLYKIPLLDHHETIWESILSEFFLGNKDISQYVLIKTNGIKCYILFCNMIFFTDNFPCQ